MRTTFCISFKFFNQFVFNTLATIRKKSGFFSLAQKFMVSASSVPMILVLFIRDCTALLLLKVSAASLRVKCQMS